MNLEVLDSHAADLSEDLEQLTVLRKPCDSDAVVGRSQLTIPVAVK